MDELRGRRSSSAPYVSKSLNTPSERVLFMSKKQRDTMRYAHVRKLDRPSKREIRVTIRNNASWEMSAASLGSRTMRKAMA